MAATLPLALDLATLERVIVRPGPEFTEDDFFEFCQEHSLLRIERNSEGDVIIMAPAGLESGFIELEVAAQLREWAKKDGRGIVAGATAGITLPDRSVLSPDACWIPIGRWEAVPRKQRQRFAPVVPAFVIEIRSPSDRRKDLQEKMQVYLRNRVELGWLIDPQARTVSIYSSERETPSELIEPERLFGEGPVAGFVLELKQIYDQL
jgi:Uma2 family endonuclease